MNEQEAIKLMLNEIVCINTADHNECERDCANCSLVKETDELLEGYNMAIKALEKQVAKKPILIKRSFTQFYVCPNCVKENDGKQEIRYKALFSKLNNCHYCGQKLDWSDEE